MSRRGKNIFKRKDGRWEGRYTAGRDPETGRAIYKNVLGKTQAEAKAKLKQAIEEAKGLDTAKVGRYTVGQWMEVWFEHYAKIKVPAILPPDLPGLHRQPHQTQHWQGPPGKTHSSGIAEVLQEAAGAGKGRPAGVQAPGQGAEPQDRAEHPPDHLLCDELSQGAETDHRKSCGGLCPAPAGAQGDENPAGGAAPVLPERVQGQRRVWSSTIWNWLLGSAGENFSA